MWVSLLKSSCYKGKNVLHKKKHVSYLKRRIMSKLVNLINFISFTTGKRARSSQSSQSPLFIFECLFFFLFHVDVFWGIVLFIYLIFLLFVSFFPEQIWQAVWKYNYFLINSYSLPTITLKKKIVLAVSSERNLTKFVT